ncbi:MAG: NAD-dependent protein deacetylase of SIR2 family [Candidatus Bipolaricaulis sibiricus]|uniref:protein acetyllysine N-acetyltransferase n=1 Tax=Bipolaricaulis sibiricus TaxID=2501609 RepID=A0A410FV81_BIPS1|nr:MAG: NAD-dependent protein deacetylase of SIR2 family [Candidatus Bipolaricaulis sibiricus]
MRPDTDAITRAARLLNQAHDAWALTGAGVSTPSGIPDFRSPGGLWELADPDEVSSIAGFRRNPEAFYSFWVGRFRQMQEAQPNSLHTLLAALEARNQLRGIITQNIDGLHQRAGSRRVFEVHGNARSGTCQTCRARYTMAEIAHQTEIHGTAHCACGGLVKPNVVLFGEDMSPDFAQAWESTANADLLLVLGTSLTVWPVAGLVPRLSARGATLIIANRDPTPYDDRAEVVLRGDLLELACALSRALGMDADA